MIICDALVNMGQDLHIRIEEATHVPQHAHWYLEFGYVLEGKANHVWNGNSEEICPGDYFIIGHLSQHSWLATTQRFRILNVLFNPVFFEPALASAKTFGEVLESSGINLDGSLFLEKPTPHTYRDADGSVQTLLFQMLDEYNRQEPGYLAFIRALFTQIIIQAMRSIYAGLPHKNKSDTFSRVIQYINHNYMHPITLKDLCGIVNYTIPQMSKKFKAAIGLSFSEYLRQLRIMTGQRLLLTSDKSIDQIMGEVGYQDKKSFYAAFRKVSGTTPDNYRKTHRQR